MKYLIVTLVKGKLEKFQQKLLYDIPKKFNAKRAILRKPPAHITLKYFFETNDIGKVEKFVKEFCKSHKKSNYRARGFGHFQNDVIFIDIDPSKEMVKTRREFLKRLESETEIEFLNVDRDSQFHISVAHTDINEEYDKIWSYVNKTNPEFNCRFDNITILKVEDNLLKVHKIYNLK